MVRRAKKTTKKKTVKRRAATKKKAPTRKKRKVSPKAVAQRKEVSINETAQWNAYQELRRQIDHAWARLRADVEHNAHPQELMRDRNELLLLLGECNYMASECMQLAAKKKR